MIRRCDYNSLIFLKQEIIEQFQDNESKMSNLEYIGFSTGYRIIERLTREMPRFKDELDTMKFICTDFWASVFKKQIDNLRTNHQGMEFLFIVNNRIVNIAFYRCLCSTRQRI